MSQEGYLARLGIDTSDIDSAVNKTITFLAELGDSFDTLGKWSDRATSSLIKNAQAAKASASATQAAGKGASDGAAGWEKYAKALDSAQAAYRDFRKGQVGNASIDKGTGLDAGDRKTLLDTAEAQSAGLVSQLRQEEQAAQDVAEMWRRLDRSRTQQEWDEDEGTRLGQLEERVQVTREQAQADAQMAAGSQRLTSIQRERAQVEAAEANRQMEIRAALAMRKREEEALTLAVAQAAAAERNRQRASAFFAGGIDTRLGQEPTGQRAADTGFAQLMRAQERQAIAAAEDATESYRSEVGRLAAAKENLAHTDAAVRVAQERVNAAMRGGDLSEQIRETNALADAQEARTRANHDLLQSEEAANAALSRTRYALYDVSQAMQAVGIAGVAVTAAIAGSAVAYEAEFANVRRTVGVTGEAADDLYDSMIRMSTTIPTSFADLGQIGTLAGQLGVAEGRVASFTRTTAQFSATTDVTVDSAATAFGRLDALLADVQGQYDRLGSSILNVGINSVATESEIVAISNQIAAASQQAGLAASEVIGLSSAMASLGIRPERARGTILRVFSEINMAVSEGGESLEAFASTSGMTSDQFRQSWGSDFTTTFLGFLDGIQAKGEGAESAIMNLGITASRDRDALLRLAQNGDIVAESLDLAAEGFENTSILAENFGIIATTNAAKIQMLGNGLLGFFATLGKGTSGPLSDFLDRLIGVTVALTRFADTPFGQTVGFITAGLAALVGILGIVGGLVLRGVGSWIALRQAIGTTTLTAWTAAGGFKALGASLLGAQGAATGFFSALKVGLATTGIGLGLVLLGEAVGFIMREMRTGQQVAEDYFGTIDGLSAAIAADNPALARQADALRETGTASRDAAGGLDEMIAAAAAQRVEMEQARAAIAAGNEALAAQEIALGENTAAWLRNQLMQSEAFKRMFENAAQMQSLMSGSFTSRGITVETDEPFSVENLLNLSATQGADAARDYINGFEAELREGFRQAGLDATEAMIASTQAADWSALTEMAEATAAAFDEARLSASLGDIVDGLLGAGEAGYEAEGGLDAAGNAAWNTSDAISRIIDAAYGADNAARALGDAMYALGAEFANNGAQAAVSSDAMQRVIQNILESSGSAATAGARLQGFFNMLVEGGYASASQLAQLQSVIAGLTGGRAISVAIPKFNPAPFVSGLQSVQRAATGRGSTSRPRGGAAAAVRTLVDYAGDLQKVFSRAFQIRFGGQKALDDVTSAWRDMRKEADDARTTIRDATEEMNAALREHQATARGLLAEKAIVKYWLSVADAYDDALRAGELRARLAEIDDELASSSEDAAKAQRDGAETIADAQRDLDRGLTGSGEAAIENRAKILDLVSGYQDYIQELAASGMSQDDLKARTAQLKEEFIRQATQLGYSREELGRYTAAFDDVTVAINKVPRNITVSANANPAIQALNEALAQMRRSASSGVSVPVRPSYSSGAGSLARTQAEEYRDAFMRYMRQRPIAIDGYLLQGQQVYRVPGTSLKLFKSGGWTGNGSPDEIAGLTHGREFVLNQTGAQMFPREMLEAANQGRAPQMPVVAMPGRGQSGPVELSPYDRSLLARAGDVRLEILNGHLAAATGAANTVMSRRGGD